jgi:hypothetical protein
MTYIKGTTKAQTIFLRGFARNPYGPPPDAWPSPVVLRRWLKRPGFCSAMNSILCALRYQADFHLTAAAASGAHLLHGTVHGGDVVEARRNIESLIHLLRMSHIRHRFAEPLPKPEPRGLDLIAVLKIAHPDITVRDALYNFDVLMHEGVPGAGMEFWQRTGHPQSHKYKPEEHEQDQQRQPLGSYDSYEDEPC